MTTVNATGTFRLQAGGPGGTVKYTWIYKDTNSQGKSVVTVHTGSVVVAAGDTNAHVITDSYVHPNSSGTVQLIFSSPSYSSPNLTQSWTCR